jgi:hypothetical protein
MIERFTKEEAAEVVSKLSKVNTKEEMNSLYDEVGGSHKINEAIIKHYEDEEVFVKLISDNAKELIINTDTKYYQLNKKPLKPLNAGSDDYIASLK